MKKLLIAITVLSLIGNIVIVSRFNKSNEKQELTLVKDSIELLPEHPYYLLEEVSDTVLYKTLVHYGFPHPEIITAQAVLETGNFKSKLCIEGNNLFGLYNSSRKQYFKFDSWISCVFKYKEYILDRYKDKESYMIFLKRINYAEDPEYFNKLEKLSKKYLTISKNI